MMRHLLYLLLFGTLLFGADPVLVRQEGSFVIVDKSTNTSFGTSGTGGTSSPALGAGEQALPTTPFNVLDYGLKGDGVTEDTNALNALANNSSVTNWYFPAGKSFLLKDVEVPAHVKAIYGGATIISKAYVGSQVNKSPYGAFTLSRTHDVSNLVIDGLRFRQQVSSAWPTQTSTTRYYGHITLEKGGNNTDVEIRNCSFDTKEFDYQGIKLLGGPGKVSKGLSIHDNVFTNCREFGIEIFNQEKTATTRAVIGVKIYNNDFTGGTGPKQRAISIVEIKGGVGLTGVPDGTESRIYNNYIHDMEWGIEVGNDSGVLVYNNIIKNISGDVLSIFTNGNSGVGVNTFYDNHLEGDHIDDWLSARILIYWGGKSVFYGNDIDCGVRVEARGSSVGFDNDFHDNDLNGNTIVTTK